jgi:hypothetical protein
MEHDAALVPVLALVVAIIALIVGWFFLFPAVCQSFPLILPGPGFDFCIFFR